MSEQLGQNEIEALFAGVWNGERPAGEQVVIKRRRVSLVDFSRPTTFSKDQERRLRRAHEVFSRTASSAITGEARTPVDFEVLDVRQLTWSNALRETGTDAIYAVIDLGSRGAHVVMSLERVFVLTLIERMCGGSDAEPAEDRRLSEIDAVLTESVMRGLIDQLSVVWDEWFDSRLAFSAIEQDTRGVQVVAQLAEPTIVVTVEAWLAKHAFVLRLMLPHSSLKASSGKFFAREGDALPEDPTAAKAMRRALGNVAVGLHARVASVEISASDLLSIATGDIVKLGPARGVTLYADDVPLHQCSPGRDGGKRAVQLGGKAR